jgi:NAD(P)-dependent dehydrogenase (short-subunit alcohol dehydrogenase family)
VALITGGGRGIDATTARMLASLGAKVALTYRNGRTTAEEPVLDRVVKPGVVTP